VFVADEISLSENLNSALFVLETTAWGHSVSEWLVDNEILLVFSSFMLETRTAWGHIEVYLITCVSQYALTCKTPTLSNEKRQSVFLPTSQIILLLPCQSEAWMDSYRRFRSAWCRHHVYVWSSFSPQLLNAIQISERHLADLSTRTRRMLWCVQISWAFAFLRKQPVITTSYDHKTSCLSALENIVQVWVMIILRPLKRALRFGDA
jgi:hypothetical protein